MSDEHDSWLQNAFGLDVGGAVQAIKDEVSAAATQVENTVTQVAQGVQAAAEGVIDTAVGAVSGAAKTVAGAVGLGDGGGSGGGAAPASGGGDDGAGLFPLKGSVGRGGKNQPGDVKAVQTALGITADGQCGGQTIAAIEAFQRNQGLPKADGRVDPGGATEKALSSGAKPSPETPPDAAEPGGLLDAARNGAAGLLEDAANLGAQALQAAEEGAAAAAGEFEDLDPSTLLNKISKPSANDPRSNLDKAYAEALKKGDFTAAAELLNGFNREDIQSRLAKLNKDQIAKLHAAAVDNPRVGPDSNVAQMTIATTPEVRIVGRPSADYVKVDVMVLVKDFQSSPIGRFNARATMTDGPFVDQREGTFTDGVATFVGWALPSEAILSLGVRAERSQFGLHGSCKFTRPKTAAKLVFEAKQLEDKNSPQEVEAENSAEAARKVGAKGTEEVDLKVGKIGGEISVEDEHKRGSKVVQKWKVSFGSDALDFKQT